MNNLHDRESISSQRSDSIESLDGNSTPGYIRPHMNISSPLGVPSFISNKSFCDNEDAQLWLNTRHLLNARDKENDELMIYCICEIAKSVSNGLSNILNIIIDHYKYEKNNLREINNIVKIAKLNNDKEQREITTSNIKNDIKRMDFLCLLPIESISLISSFLEKVDIKSLKLVSADIGSICLNHMNQYRFGICNINKLFLYPIYYKNIQNLTLDYKKIMNYDCYHSSQTLYNLKQNIEIKYKIPFEYQLLSTTKKLLINNDNEDKQIRQISKMKRQYFVFDMRNIIKIGPKLSSKPEIMNDNDKTEYGARYKLQLLQYFDVSQQILLTIQVLLIDKNNTTPNMIIHYIQNAFIPTTKQQKIWYNSICNQLKSSQLSLYQCCKQNDNNNNNINLMIRIGPKPSKKIIRAFNKKEELLFNHVNFKGSKHNHESLIFQIDFSSKTDDKYIEKLEEEYKLNQDHFCKTATLFNEKLNKSFNVKFKYLHNNNLMKSFLSYLQQINGKEDDYKMDIDYLFDKEYQQSTLTNYGKIRIEISKLFDNIIPASNIQLYKRYNYNDFFILKWDDKVKNEAIRSHRSPFIVPMNNAYYSSESHISQQNRRDIDVNTIYFEFVSYDTRQNLHESTSTMLPKISRAKLIFRNSNSSSNTSQSNNDNKKSKKRKSRLSFTHKIFKKRNSNKDINRNKDINGKDTANDIKHEHQSVFQISSASSISTTPYLKHNEYVFFVKIFASNQVVTPSIISNNEQYKSITVKFCNIFRINEEFIQRIMTEIKKPVHGNAFTDILNLYFQNPDIDTNGDILYALMLDHKTYFLNDEYSNIRHQNQCAVHHLNLIIYRNPNSFTFKTNVDINYNIPIIIRLWINNHAPPQYHAGINLYPVHNINVNNINDETDLYGVPLRLWIKPGQTLQEIINAHQELNKLLITKCYEFLNTKHENNNNLPDQHTFINNNNNNTLSSILTPPMNMISCGIMNNNNNNNDNVSSDDSDDNDDDDNGLSINTLPRFQIHSTTSNTKPVKQINPSIYEPTANDVLILEIRDNNLTHTYLPAYRGKLR